jgi:hypothetical protein
MEARAAPIGASRGVARRTANAAATSGAPETTGPAASVDDWAGITPTSTGHAVAKPTRAMATATTVLTPATSGITRSGNKIGSGVPARGNCSAAGKGVVPAPASRPILDIDGGAGGG